MQKFRIAVLIIGHNGCKKIVLLQNSFSNLIISLHCSSFSLLFGDFVVQFVFDGDSVVLSFLSSSFLSSSFLSSSFLPSSFLSPSLGLTVVLLSDDDDFGVVALPDGATVVVSWQLTKIQLN